MWRINIAGGRLMGKLSYSFTTVLLFCLNSATDVTASTPAHKPVKRNVNTIILLINCPNTVIVVSSFYSTCVLSNFFPWHWSDIVWLLSTSTINPFSLNITVCHWYQSLICSQFVFKMRRERICDYDNKNQSIYHNLAISIFFVPYFSFFLHVVLFHWLLSTYTPWANSYQRLITNWHKSKLNGTQVCINTHSFTNMSRKCHKSEG